MKVKNTESFLLSLACSKASIYSSGHAPHINDDNEDLVDDHKSDTSDDYDDDDHCHRVQMALLVAMVMLDWIITC